MIRSTHHRDLRATRKQRLVQ